MFATAARLMISLGLCAGFAASPAVAAPDRPRAIVRTADLDLASVAGERTLRHRIANAAGTMCGEADPRDRRMAAAVAGCRAAAMASAAPQIEVALANARTARALAARDTPVSPATRS